MSAMRSSRVGIPSRCAEVDRMLSRIPPGRVVLFGRVRRESSRIFFRKGVSCYSVSKVYLLFMNPRVRLKGESKVQKGGKTQIKLLIRTRKNTDVWLLVR